MERITTTIRREPLAAIIAGTKRIEYREIKAYWRKKLERVSLPFELRLINGMQKKCPEVTMVIRKVRKNTREGVYELHIGKVLSYKNWNAKKKQPR